MRATVTKCLIILVLLALSVTNAIAQPPTPEATPTPTATGPIRVGPFALSDLVGLATLAGIIIVGFLSAYTARVLGPMQRREVELLERQVGCLEREKEALANVLREEKTLLEMQLRDAKEKANIPHDATLPPQPMPLDPKDRETLQELLTRLERIESVSIAAGAETPQPDPWEYISEANLHYRLLQYEQAIQKYNKALELKPDFPMALNNRGAAYTYLRQYERAIEDYDRALDLSPNDPVIYANRASAHFRLGQREQAERDLQHAIQLTAESDTGRYGIACVYSLMGNPTKAVAWLQKAIEIDHSWLQRAKSDSDFDNIRDDPRFKELVGE